MILTGLLAISGTVITSYGYLNDITSLLILGPIVATSGKLLFFSVLFFPKLIILVKSRLQTSKGQI